jgi:meso-butanediol dehydrogenase / (S,S)-butanediol dehydrogenase / diacetyl reductase
MNEENSKVVIVTGGGTGIGKAIAERFVTADARVLVVGRREVPLAALAEQYPAARLSYLVADLTRAEDRARIVPTAIDRYGRLDVLVNNAGAFCLGGIEHTTDEQYEQVYATNVVAPASLIRAAVPHLTPTRGCVINLSTVVARAAFPGTSVYVSSKAALNQLTRVLARELGPLGIRVNAVAPGATKTEMGNDALDAFGEEAFVSMTPLGRIGEPADIAQSVYFLASPEGAWITGQILEASGGMSL